ncbi:unnamed protein product [Chondrus crispus]|uniref:Uncharacterized protein n=1 Tax=Chondrus crispus TaxID=2769 RepID=R7Q5W8_CHOCR|nr:unnamed protein product [Chondrus crispus]CDF32860.1 unnamed protein product [Chondrus crispus]|eukprot:XP_005712661.1 unnamed protein product [Chondrus crispus]
MIRTGTFFLLALLALFAVAFALDEIPVEGDLTEQNDIGEDMNVAERSYYPYYPPKRHHGYPKKPYYPPKRHHGYPKKPYYPRHPPKRHHRYPRKYHQKKHHKPYYH